MFVVLVVADLAWASARAVDGFQQARDSLESGGQSLQSGDVATARNDFAAAESAGAQAQGSLSHPSVSLVGALPWFSDEIDAARRGADAIVLASQGGGAYADAAEAAGWDGTNLPGFAPGGHIDAGAIQRAAPDIEKAADLLGQADAELSPIDTSTLQAPLDRLVGDAKDEIHARAQQASVAAGLAELLPPMLGADGERTYLLVTVSPSDPRGTGGYPGVYGLLHTDGKQIRLSGLAASSDIPEVKRVDGPADVKKAWGWAGIDSAFWDTTYTPDFPTAAGFMKGIWEAGGGQPVDGVIAGDPALMSALLAVTGPVDTPAWPETITADNVEQIVGADVYKTTSQEQSDAWEIGIGDALWSAVFTRPLPMEALSSAISSSVAGGHLQVWSADAGEETALTELGADGSFELPADGSPVVTLTGFTSNRAGYFAKKNVEVERGVDAKGRPTMTVTVTIENRAPDGPPSILLGMHPSDVGGKPIGTFGTDVNVYMPKGSTVVSASENGRDEIPYRVGRARGARCQPVDPDRRRARRPS